MVVCRYFQQGNCNFGERCRFEHPRQQGFGQQSFGGGGKFQNTFASNNRFAALASGDGNRNQPQQAIKDMQPQEIIDIICQEMRVWEISHMWPFSCFTYAKDGRCITGFEDLSPEELRNEAYETKKSNSFQNYQMKVSTLSAEYRMKRQALRNPNTEMKQKLLQEIQAHKAGDGKTPLQSSAFGQVTGAGAAPKSVFGNTPSTVPAQGLFGKPAVQPVTGLFGSATTTGQNQFGAVPATQNPFTQAQSSQSAFGAAPSAFGNTGGPGTGGQAGSPSAGIFGASATASGGVFSAQPASQGSTFGSPPAAVGTAAPFGQQPPMGLFGKPGVVPQSQPGLFGKSTVQPPSGLFGKPVASQSAVPSPFGNSTSTVPAQPTTQAAPTGLFGKPAQAAVHDTGLFGKPAVGGSNAISAFGNSLTASVPQNDSLYTALTQLTEQERTQFSATKFVLGQIPTRPPPREMV